ncbi:hypothetical protein [Burkholderia sp. LMG 21824]|uniref:hypothetical protein n=1 Tax=Burkholderia sp. LMG 21824 TaxID=3158172 RepID=UPI003C2FB17F
MKILSGTGAPLPVEDGKTATAVAEVVGATKLDAARREARALRAMFDALSPLERAVAGKQIAAVRRLVEAVEAL